MVPKPTVQESTLDHRKYFIIGIALTTVGAVTTVLGFEFAHFSGQVEPKDLLGRDAWAWIPRGWTWELLGQVVALGGVMLLMAGIALAFLYRRKLTWARASLGALLFTGLTIIVYGIVPNQWLSITQGELSWTGAKTALTIPKWMVLNNDVSISLAAIKDAVSGGYNVVATGAIVAIMYQWQEREKKRKAGPPPQPISNYGRPVTRIGRN